MNTERYQQIRRLFEAALEYPADVRGVLLREACGSDEELLTEIRKLLDAHDDRTGWIDGDTSETHIIASAMIERYEIQRELGRGGMGIVYEATDRETRETVALKVLRPEIAADGSAMTRFKNELRLARKITHKNVCRIYEFGRTEKTAYISMEFVDGDSLRAILSRFKALSVRTAIRIAVQICAGLQEAHAQGVIHRDLKPENIMIDRAGDAKIMDFGIARVATGTATDTGIIGTPAYMAPEQAESKSVDGRVDIYALGLVLYEMLTGEPVFTAESAVALALKQIHATPVPLRQLEPTIPPYLERVVMRCIEKDPARRIQSTPELSASLLSESPEHPKASDSVPKKSLIVLPFKDISSARNNEYFCDGLTEEITGDLSQIHNLRVVSTTSAMKLRNTAKDLKTIGQESAVQYVLEGSVRHHQNDIRIAAQLIDVLGDETLWSEKYKGTLEDVFEIQEKVSRSILDALRVRLSPDEDIGIARRALVRKQVEAARRQPDAELLQFLRNVKLFAELDADMVLKLSSMMPLREFAESEILIREGESGGSMVVVRTGWVDVLKDDAATGAHVLISKLAPGGVFGEVSLLTGESRIATLAAAGPTTVSILGRDDFQWLVRVYPEVSLGLGKVLVERLAEATRIGIHVDPHVH